MALRRRIHVADSDDFGLGDIELPGGGRVLLGRAHDEPSRTSRGSANGVGAPRAGSVPASPAETDASRTPNAPLSDRFRGRNSLQRAGRPTASVSPPRGSMERLTPDGSAGRETRKQHRNTNRKEGPVHHSKLHHGHFSEGDDGHRVLIPNIPQSFTVVYDDELIVDGSTGQGKVPPNIVDAAVLRRAFKECYKAFTAVINPEALRPGHAAHTDAFKRNQNEDDEVVESQRGSVKLEESSATALRRSASPDAPRFSGFSFTSALSCSSDASSSASSDPTYVSDSDSPDDDDEEEEDAEDESDGESDAGRRRNASARKKPEENSHGNRTAPRSRNASAPLKPSRKRKRTDEVRGEEGEYVLWTVGDLKDHLRERGLPVSGTKAVLIARIQQANTMASNEPDSTVEPKKDEEEDRQPTPSTGTWPTQVEVRTNSPATMLEAEEEEEEERSAVGSFLSARSSAAVSVGYPHIAKRLSDGYSFNASAPRRVASAPRSYPSADKDGSATTGSFSLFKTLANVGSRLFRYSTGSVDSASTQGSQHSDTNRVLWRRSV